MATTTSDINARCLSLTRLVSRIGRGPRTGVDRVELKYLERLVADPIPLFVLVRTRLGFVLLDQTGARKLLHLFKSDDWGKMDLLSRMGIGIPQSRRQAGADLRKLAIGRCRPDGLTQLLIKHLPAGTSFFNVGHTDWSEHWFSSVQAVAQSHVTVMVHDVIPLTHPQFQRPGTPETFRRKLNIVNDCADTIIFPTEFSRTSAASSIEIRPDTVAAHLGIEVQPSDLADIPKIAQPYFVVLGTIEPRKNHALLLDIWDSFTQRKNAPLLVIIGNRGWNNDAVFQRLDAKPKNVLELNNCTDDDVGTLLRGAAGLLFPSHTEGFGLPAAEAAAMNVPVVCNRLSVFQEFLGDYPVYVDVSDMYLWITMIDRLAGDQKSASQETSKNPSPVVLPTWEEHFALVLVNA